MWSSDLTMSTNPLLQTIEALAKEKGIEPDVVIQAMEEAVLTASRKFYKTGEELKAKFNPENGQIELFAVKTIVDEVTDPALEISSAGSVTSSTIVFTANSSIWPFSGLNLAFSSSPVL